jgi:hypothetical protein
MSELLKFTKAIYKLQSYQKINDDLGKIGGKTSGNTIEVRLNPAIDLTNTNSSLIPVNIGVNNIEYNISAILGNNSFVYYDGIKIQEVYFNDGIYEISDIINIINSDTNINGNIVLSLNNNTGIISITVILPFYLIINTLITTLLGFSPIQFGPTRTLVPPVSPFTFVASNPAYATDNNNYYVRCSATTPNSHVQSNGISLIMSIIAVSSTKVVPYARINFIKSQADVFKSQISPNINYLERVKFELIKEDGSLVYFTGNQDSEFSVFCHIVSDDLRSNVIDRKLLNS